MRTLPEKAVQTIHSVKDCQRLKVGFKGDTFVLFDHLFVEDAGRVTQVDL